MHIDAAKAAYRRYANFYDAIWGLVLQPGRKAVVEAMKCKPGDHVLEVGVGTGISLPLFPRSVRITGVDLSHEMLEKARARKARKKLDNVEALLEMDAEAMTFPDQSFDKVVAMYVVSAVENPARVLDELHRVCKPDGEIFIVNHIRSDNRLVGGIERSLGRFTNQLGFHPDFELGTLLDGRHEVTQVSRINFFWRMMRVKNGIARPRVATG